MLRFTLSRYKLFNTPSVREGFVLVYFPLHRPSAFILMQDFSVSLLSTLHSTHQHLPSRKGKVERIQIIFLMLFHCLWDWVKDLSWFEHCRLETKARTTVPLQLTDTPQTLPLSRVSRCSRRFSFFEKKKSYQAFLVVSLLTKVGRMLLICFNHETH